MPKASSKIIEFAGKKLDTKAIKTKQQAEDIVATPSGYTPGQGAPMVEGITEESEDSTFDIVYTPNDQHAVLRIVDNDTIINGKPKEIFTTSATGKYGTIINFADLAESAGTKL